jgi:ubiquitin C-terminal hydrolase
MRFYKQDGTYKDYFILGIITHYGSHINAGHYTSMTFNKFDTTTRDMVYTLYDDADAPITTKVPFIQKFLPKSAYIKPTINNPMPYIILYQEF